MKCYKLSQLSLVNTPRRNFFFGRRLLNKSNFMAKQEQKIYDPTEYYEAIKSFQVRTRGLSKNEEQYDSIRNEFYESLSDKQKKSKAKEIEKAGNLTKAIDKQFIANFDKFYSSLIVVPEQTGCYETYNILNYFGYPITVEEDDIYNPKIKKEMAYELDTPFPLFIQESSNPAIPNLDLAGSDNILLALRKNNSIGDYKSHSAEETHALQFITSKVQPLIWVSQISFKSKFQFYVSPAHFKAVQVERDTMLFKFMYLRRIRKIFYTWYQDRKEFGKGENEFQDLKQQELVDKIHEVLDEWVMRLDGKDYHGGDRFGPDLADFRMFSEFNRVEKLPLYKSIFKHRQNGCKFNKWHARMTKECKNNGVPR